MVLAYLRLLEDPGLWGGTLNRFWIARGQSREVFIIRVRVISPCEERLQHQERRESFTSTSIGSYLILSKSHLLWRVLGYK
jgi:hypothetical protein